MLEIFRALLWLDGEAVEGAPGAEFYKEVRNIVKQGNNGEGGKMEKPHVSKKPHVSSNFCLVN